GHYQSVDCLIYRRNRERDGAVSGSTTPDDRAPTAPGSKAPASGPAAEDSSSGSGSPAGERPPAGSGQPGQGAVGSVRHASAQAGSPQQAAGPTPLAGAGSAAWPSAPEGVASAVDLVRLDRPAVLVAGAGGGGIGTAVCQAVARAGGIVVAVDRAEEGRRLASKALAAAGGDGHLVLDADLADPASVDAAVARAVAAVGPLRGSVH